MLFNKLYAHLPPWRASKIAAKLKRVLFSDNTKNDVVKAKWRFQAKRPENILIPGVNTGLKKEMSVLEDFINETWANKWFNNDSNPMEDLFNDFFGSHENTLNQKQAISERENATPSTKAQSSDATPIVNQQNTMQNAKKSEPAKETPKKTDFIDKSDLVPIQTFAPIQDLEIIDEPEVTQKADAAAPALNLVTAELETQKNKESADSAATQGAGETDKEIFEGLDRDEVKMLLQAYKNFKGEKKMID